MRGTNYAERDFLVHFKNPRKAGLGPEADSREENPLNSQTSFHFPNFSLCPPRVQQQKTTYQLYKPTDQHRGGGRWGELGPSEFGMSKITQELYFSYHLLRGENIHKDQSHTCFEDRHLISLCSPVSGNVSVSRACVLA